MKLITLFILLALAAPALARIGETQAQCKARYGESTPGYLDQDHLIFEKAGYQVTCRFYEGKCDFIMFSKLETNDKGQSVSIPQEELKVLLQSSSGGAEWTQTDDGKKTGIMIWTCGDLLARYFYEEPSYMGIMTNAHKARAEAAMAAKDRVRLKDF